jgi:hypothetical protein
MTAMELVFNRARSSRVAEILGAFFVALAIAHAASHNQREMSGIFFDLPSLRFLQRSRFFETRMRTFASSLLRWLSALACGSRQVHFRLNKVEFPAASQSACKLFEWTLGDSRAADCASIDALRPFNNWVKLKNQHELLFIWETAPPFAGRIPTQRRPRTLSGSARRNESEETDILAADRRIFRRRHRHKENRNARAQWCAAFPAVTKT